EITRTNIIVCKLPTVSCLPVIPIVNRSPQAPSSTIRPSKDLPIPLPLRALLSRICSLTQIVIPVPNLPRIPIQILDPKRYNIHLTSINLEVIDLRKKSYRQESYRPELPL